MAATDPGRARRNWNEYSYFNTASVWRIIIRESKLIYRWISSRVNFSRLRHKKWQMRATEKNPLNGSWTPDGQERKMDKNGRCQQRLHRVNSLPLNYRTKLDVTTLGNIAWWWDKGRDGPYDRTIVEMCKHFISMSKPVKKVLDRLSF